LLTTVMMTGAAAMPVANHLRRLELGTVPAFDGSPASPGVLVESIIRTPFCSSWAHDRSGPVTLLPNPCIFRYGTPEPPWRRRRLPPSTEFTQRPNQLWFANEPPFIVQDRSNIPSVILAFGANSRPRWLHFRETGTFSEARSPCSMSAQFTTADKKGATRAFQARLAPHILDCEPPRTALAQNHPFRQGMPALTSTSWPAQPNRRLRLIRPRADASAHRDRSCPRSRSLAARAW